MGILKNFTPDLMVNNIYTLTPEYFQKYSGEGVVFDIDNTIAPYTVPDPNDDMKAYFARLSDEGIKVAFVSNNSAERVDRFNAEFGFFTCPDAHKPSPDGILLCIQSFGIPKDKVIFVGDQIFTDCFAARRAGVRCFLVQPIAPVETWFMRFKRVLEKPFVAHYMRKNKNQEK